MLAIFAALGLAHASDVVVPSFTPATLSDFGTAEKMTAETLRALNEREVLFVPPSEIRLRAGEVAEGCAENKACMDTLWEQFPPSRLAIVGRLNWNEGMLEANVRFYGPDDASPIEVMSSSFPEDEMGRFADQVAFFAAELLSLVPPREETVVPVAVEPIQRQPEPATPAAPAAPADAGAGEPLAKGPSRQSAGMMPKKVWARYEASGLTWRRFKERELVRAGSVMLELHGAGLFGAVNRAYDVRVGVLQDEELAPGQDPSEASFSQAGYYQRDGFTNGISWTVGASLGYVPIWWLEIGVSGGMQVGRKELTTGWEQYVVTVDGDPTTTSEDAYDPTLAFMGMVEPRLRWYVVPTGPVKPYIITGAHMRFYDGYIVPDSALIRYPDRAGGLSVGATTGAGLAFDAPGGFAAFLDVPYTYLLSPRTFERQEGTITYVPGERQQSNQLVGFRAGLGFRI